MWVNTKEESDPVHLFTCKIDKQVKSRLLSNTTRQNRLANKRSRLPCRQGLYLLLPASTDWLPACSVAHSLPWNERRSQGPAMSHAYFTMINPSDVMRLRMWCRYGKDRYQLETGSFDTWNWSDRLLNSYLLLINSATDLLTALTQFPSL